MFGSKATEVFTQREKRQFQEMLGLYDEKIYAKSIKIADNLLENYPDHPETRAFRALSMSGLGKMKEAVKEIKAVLMKNMMNYTCWHIMGIIHRKEKEYDQARRAYLFALKCDANNEQTMRELIQLQVHLRDFVGFEETSRKLLLLKPSVMQYWVQLASACYQSRNYNGCHQAIESVLKFDMEDGAQKKSMKPHEVSEIALLGVRCFLKQGKYAEALAYLKKNDQKIVDTVAKADFLGEINHALGNEAQAVEAYETLLSLNSANLDTYKKVLGAKGVELPKDLSAEPLSQAYQGIVKGVLDGYIQGFPRVNAHLRIGLRYLYGQNFNDYLEKYMRPMIIKGVPSLMMDLREFYVIPEKVDMIGAYLDQCLSSMESEMTLTAGDDDEQDPTVMLWLLYFHAQHKLFQNKLSDAMNFVNRAIEHTPTLLELYTLKGIIYQKSGDRQKAAELHEEARNMDKADRAINAISAMFTLKNGQVELGTGIMDIFVKDCGYDVSIHDNQTMWFEQMTGRAHYINKDYRKALKEFKYVQLHAEHMVQDHYDYYQYCMRRFTLRTFEDLLTFADKTLKQNRTVIKTAISYLRLLHRVTKEKEQEKAAFEPVYQEYLESEDHAKLMETLNKAEDEDEYKNDTDPQGFFAYKKLLDGEFDLTEWVEKVASVNTDANLHAKAIPAFLAKGKLLAALKSVICLKEQHASHPKTVVSIVKLFKGWLQMTDEQKMEACGGDQRILSVVASEVAALGCPATEADLPGWFSSNRVTNSGRPLEEHHEFVKAQMSVFGAQPTAEWGAKAVQALQDNPMMTLSVWPVIKMHQTLVKTGLNGVGTAFEEKAKEMYPLSTHFTSE